LPDRLPVAPGRLHDDSGHPEAPSHSANSTSPVVVVATNVRVSTWRLPWLSGIRTQAVTKSLCRSSRRRVRPASPPACLLHLGNSHRHPEEPLPRESESHARGNRAGCPRLPRQSYRRTRGTKEHRRRPDDLHISSVAGGRPWPWEAISKCREPLAKGRSPRSRAIVDGEAMWSIGMQLCVLPIRLQTH
jgi:hypothetical protein